MAGPYGDFENINDNVGSTTSGAVSGSYNAGQQGIFASQPLQTPKYARNQGLRDAEFKDTLARIYVSLADASPAVQNAYLQSLPSAARGLGAVLLGNNSAGSSGYVDFILSQATEAVQEVMQVEKVVSDDYVAFFFGQTPPVFQYTGFLINSQQDDQRMSFYQAYREILRGTALARAGAIARLRYDSVIISGVMCAHQQQLVAENEVAVPFSFNFLVKEYVIIPQSTFVHTSADDFVELVADQAVANLGSLQRPSDVRVRTAAVLPPNQALLSTAGPDTSASAAAAAAFAGLNVLQLTTLRLQLDQALAQAQAQQSNFRGSLDKIKAAGT